MCLEGINPDPPYSPQRLPPTIWLKTPSTPEKGDGTAPENSPLAEEAEERLILCRECLFPITREEEQTSMSGASQHTFANPAGIVFNQTEHDAHQRGLAGTVRSDQGNNLTARHRQVDLVQNCASAE